MAQLILPDSRFEAPSLFVPRQKPVGAITLRRDLPIGPNYWLLPCQDLRAYGTSGLGGFKDSDSPAEFSVVGTEYGPGVLNEPDGAQTITNNNFTDAAKPNLSFALVFKVVSTASTAKIMQWGGSKGGFTMQIKTLGEDLDTIFYNDTGSTSFESDDEGGIPAWARQGDWLSVCGTVNGTAITCDCLNWTSGLGWSATATMVDTMAATAVAVSLATEASDNIIFHFVLVDRSTWPRPFAQRIINDPFHIFEPA